MFYTRYQKGTKLRLSVTYEIDVEIEEDGAFTPSDLWSLANNTILQADSLDSHLTDCKVVSEMNHIEQARALWDELREGKDHAKCPDLNENQIKFIQDVIAAGLEGELRTYSGRGMFGQSCPGVVVGHTSELPTTVRYVTDNMGMNIIMYVP